MKNKVILLSTFLLVVIVTVTLGGFLYRYFYIDKKSNQFDNINTNTKENADSKTIKSSETTDSKTFSEKSDKVNQEGDNRILDIESNQHADKTSEESIEEGTNSDMGSLQSDKMLEFTGVPWSQKLEDELKNVDFDSFGFSLEDPTLISDVNSLFVLVNKANYFPDEFVPINLVSPKTTYMGGGDRNRLRKVAADALDELVLEAEKNGLNIKSVSAYRSIDYQSGLFNSYAAKDGVEKANKYSSKPGHSEHHTGLCTDVSSPVMGFGLDQSYGNTKEGIWLANNAHRFGFVIRYIKDKELITGYTYEPWHIRYFGIPLASYLYETELTYEEFIALQRGMDIEEIIIKN